jgi:hypothetical protein
MTDRQVVKSIVRMNAEKDPNYRPYCMRCSGLVRMRIVEDFFWKCGCGAIHDERGADAKKGAPGGT